MFSIIFTSFNVIVFSNAFVGGMLRCVFTVQRYEYFFTIDDIFFLEGEGGVAEIGGTCGCLYTVCILFVYSDVYCLYTLMYSECILQGILCLYPAAAVAIPWGWRRGGTNDGTSGWRRRGGRRVR